MRTAFRSATLKKIRTAILTHWPIKVTALVLATVLWGAVATEIPTEQVVPVTLQVDAPAGRAIVSPLPPVRALYAGAPRELLKLYADPPVIQKQIPDTLTGTEFLVELSPDDLRPVRDANVKAQGLEPRVFPVTLDDVVRRIVPVVSRVTLSADSGFLIAGPPRVIPDSVTIQGPEAAVRAVSEVRTVILDLTGLRSDVRRSVALDTTGLSPVRLPAASVELVATVVAVSERVLMGVPVVVNAPVAAGWVSEPPAVIVTVHGPRDRIARLTRDSVEVRVTPPGNNTSETVRVEVIPPSGVTAAATPDTVVLQRRPRG